MASYLVSFTIPGGRLGWTYGSHVVYLQEAPLTAQAVTDLVASMAMEYSIDKAILSGWDILPDADAHPGDGPYCYFVSYAYVDSDGPGLAAAIILLPSPICTLGELRFCEEWLGADQRAWEVRLTHCKPLKEPTQQMLEEYGEILVINNPN